MMNIINTECVKSLLKSALRPFHRKTLSSHQVAHVFREPFIQTGYRLPNQSLSYYWKSLFWIHNETINIWSHLFAAIMVLKNIWEFSKDFDFIDDKYGRSLIGFSLGCFLGTFISSMAHLFHSKSMRWHYVLFMVDYAGVNLYTFGTGIGCIYICSQKDVYRYLEPFFLPLNAFLSWFTFFICCRAKLKCTSYSRGLRLATMILAYIFYALIISVPVFARYYECMAMEGCSLKSLNHLTVCFGLIASSGVPFASHAPERFAPGKFDIVGHGHSLFHLISFAAILNQMEGVRVDIREGSAAHTRPRLDHIVLAYVTLITAQLMTIFYLRFEIANKIKSDMRTWYEELTNSKHD